MVPAKFLFFPCLISSTSNFTSRQIKRARNYLPARYAYLNVLIADPRSRTFSRSPQIQSQNVGPPLAPINLFVYSPHISYDTAPCNCDGTYPPSASLIAALDHNINRRTPYYITYFASTMLNPTLNQYLAMLMGDDITTMSEFQVANTILADAIKLTHQMIHAPTSRQSTTGGVISSPHVRYSFITKHSTKLACCFCPTLIPYK